MIKNLIKLADHLDKKGLHKEADYVDWIIKKSSDEEDPETIARKELFDMVDRTKTLVGESQGRVYSYMLDSFIDDFDSYLEYLEYPEEDFDIHTVNMMKKHYPVTTSLESEIQKRLISEAIESLRSIS